MAQLLSNLPVGAKIKFGKYSVNGEAAQPIIWLVVSKNTDTSAPSKPQNSVTLLTEKVIDYRCFDAQEPLNPYEVVVDGGYNRYAYSNLGQWLNSDAPEGQWYTPQHTYDQAPIAEHLGNNTPYYQRPGFLHSFTSSEKNAIVTTTILTARNKWDGAGNDTVYQKVFIPSMAEVTTNWNYFAAGGSRICYSTAQVNSNSTISPAQTEGVCDWWTRDANDSMYEVIYVNDRGEVTSDISIDAYRGWIGVRPALNLPTTLSISDSMDSDGCYNAIWNTAPTNLTAINVPQIYGGKSTAISWSSAIDPDGDALTYQLECSVNGGAYAQIYSGASTSYAHLVPFGTTSVAYRVKATDPSGESSAYTNSATMTVINNNAPVISGADANLGVKSEGFTGTYTITDANSDAVTVTEAIDGVQIRALVATLGSTITYGVTENTWLALPNGSHTLTISATDGIDTTVRRYTFTKLVDNFTIQNSTPWQSANMPSRIMMVVTKNIPSAATFKVEVCNNGYDTSPTWEDATDAVVSGLVHVFANKTKTATNWGVKFRVTVERNGAAGACYVSAIGGNFE